MLPRDLGNGSRTAESRNPVVVGVDGSFTAIRAARWAAAVAAMLEAPLHIVHGRPSLGHNLSDAVADIRATESEVQRESATAILQSARHAAESDVGDLHVTTTEMDSPADEALTELSRTARLIVLGCDEVSLGTAILIGSTTTAVATHSICPVVAWRGQTTTPTRQPIVARHRPRPRQSRLQSRRHSSSHIDFGLGAHRRSRLVDTTTSRRCPASVHDRLEPSRK